jgi:hypothetical protein
MKVSGCDDITDLGNLEFLSSFATWFQENCKHPSLKAALFQAMLGAVPDRRKIDILPLPAFTNATSIEKSISDNNSPEATKVRFKKVAQTIYLKMTMWSNLQHLLGLQD